MRLCEGCKNIYIRKGKVGKNAVFMRIPTIYL
uniref:Uncharacterized protein n=1 Tax=Siphoviridae sp. ct0Xn2 TaxID=2826267 RepID=A0A8S5MT87_9CAUD|nr:MAG TPA: hypothetical protein [Siphoviridae sp. ct0Xn2]DAM46879.1 MAG TPA: hypothetical protein [Caudoviricetes sp.]